MKNFYRNVVLPVVLTGAGIVAASTRSGPGPSMITEDYRVSRNLGISYIVRNGVPVARRRVEHPQLTKPNVMLTEIEFRPSERDVWKEGSITKIRAGSEAHADFLKGYYGLRN